MMMNGISTPANPFRYGSLALDEAFADREAEVQELKFDVMNGQDVDIFAPRRFGKSSLVWKVMRQLEDERALVAYVNLMTTPSKARLAGRLAAAIHAGIASPLERAREAALAPFRGLRVVPQISIDPGDGSFAFSFGVEHSDVDIDATLERLLQLPGELGYERGRRVALILDEFQEIESIDSTLPRLMRTIFEQQPEVAHVYLGSKRHMMERIFNDENEPFWRSAKRTELTLIDPALFQPFIAQGFERTNKRADEAVLVAVLNEPAAIHMRPRNSATSSGRRRPSMGLPPKPSSSAPSVPSYARRTPTSSCAGRTPPRRRSSSSRPLPSSRAGLSRAPTVPAIGCHRRRPCRRRSGP